jgi:peroxiredoxin Q/BCP
MTGLHEGDEAPRFDLKDQNGRPWRLADLRGKKVILYFYPADDTPGCTAEACDFRDSLDDLVESGYVVLGVSPQDEKSHQAFASKYSLNFPLLIDAKFEVARAYSALAEKRRSDGGVDLNVLRCTFVIDENGRVEQALYGVRARGHVSGLKQMLEVPAAT